MSRAKNDEWRKTRLIQGHKERQVGGGLSATKSRFIEQSHMHFTGGAHSREQKDKLQCQLKCDLLGRQYCWITWEHEGACHGRRAPSSSFRPWEEALALVLAEPPPLANAEALADALPPAEAWANAEALACAPWPALEEAPHRPQVAAQQLAIHASPHLPQA